MSVFYLNMPEIVAILDIFGSILVKNENICYSCLKIW